MKKILFLTFIVLLLTSCKSNNNCIKRYISNVKIDTLLSDKISIRAITIDNEKIYYAGDKNRVGFVDLVTKKRNEKANFSDTIKAEFRSIAQVNNSIFILNVGNPAHLYKLSKDLKNENLVYNEMNEKVFYDSMQFWNENEGIAIGDPIENCFSILITRDGGNSWSKLSCSELPKIEEGEAAFAASNTNIVVKGNKTWLVSGGKKARVFYSPNNGKSWQVFETPIVQGETMTGIFTADFYDENIGFIAGGNYEKPNQNFQNKALTIDGGKTWKLVGENTGFGYASCIQFVPESKGNELVCVGAKGIFFSNDKGTTWKQLNTDESLYTIRFIDKNTAIAAGKNKIVRIEFR